MIDFRYAMEMHLVHMNSKYNDITEALAQPDGLAVLGVMFIVSVSKYFVEPGMNGFYVIENLSLLLRILDSITKIFTNRRCLKVL